MRWISYPLGGVLVLAILGCARKPTADKELPPLTVPVALPIEREVTDYVDFTGRTDSVNGVEIRPRVTGYLMKMPFKEGDEVKANDLLFEVDPRPYQAQLDRSKADVNLQEAKAKLAKADNVRAKAVYAMNPGAISLQDLDKYQAAEEEAVAAVLASKAQMEVAQLNRNFCEVTSPIDGQVSRYYYTLGNLVNQDTTTLTTVVSVDPIYVYFDVDERTLLGIRQKFASGQLKTVKPGTSDIPVYMEVAVEEGYPHRGTINFVNNRVDPLTGTITLRGEFPNARPKPGVPRLLSPGLFVRVRLPLGEPHKAVLISQKAIASDQGIRYVYVVDAENKVQKREIKIGQPQGGGLSVIEDGVKPGDWIVISGIQMVRPKEIVKTVKTTMPVVGEPTEAAKPTDAAKATPPVSTPDKGK